MSKEWLEDIRGTLDDIRMYEARETRNQEQADFAKCYLVEMYGEWFIEQAERSIELEQENETLRSANEDLLKENHTLKNFNKIDIDHPSNKFF